MRFERLSIIVLVGTVIRLLPIIIPTLNISGVVDIYHADTEAANVILAGQNPYSHTFSSLSGPTHVFAYLPMVPLFLAPFQLVFGDVRYGAIFADMVITISIFFISRTAFGPRWCTLAPLGFALLPTSIALTSFIGSNIMVGVMFFMAALATLFSKKDLLFAIMFGLGLASSQLLLLAIPFLALYLYTRKRAWYMLLSIAIGSAVILPFLLLSPRRFIYDVVFFQFARPLQSNGMFGLYYLIYDGTGFLELNLAIRAALTIIVAVLTWKWVGLSNDTRLLGALAIFMAIAAFILPVNGFWSYYLPSMAIACSMLTLLPTVFQRPHASKSELRPRLKEWPSA